MGGLSAVLSWLECAGLDHPPIFLLPSRERGVSRAGLGGARARIERSCRCVTGVCGLLGIVDI